MGHTERKHSLLSPSSSHTWLHCTKAPVMQKDFPDTTSAHAAEGTLAHELAEAKVRNYFYPQDMSKQKLAAFIRKLKKHDLWDNEMLDHTESYLDAIKECAMSFDSAPYVVPEREYDLTMYIPEEGAHGTADCVLLHGSEMHVFDFKYGKGVTVSADDNPQLKLYALGAYDTYKMLYPIETIHLHIIQPRINNYSEWSLTKEELFRFADFVAARAQLAISGNGAFAPGADTCRFCRAKAVCRARAEKNVELAFMISTKPDTVGNDEIGAYLEKGLDIAKWVEDLKAHALSECLAGHDVKGWKAVEGRGSRAWADQDKALDTLIEKGIAEAVLYERKPLTLAQIEKEIGKKDFNEMVGDFVLKQPGKPALVPESDKRQAITGIVQAKDVFNTPQ